MNGDNDALRPVDVTAPTLEEAIERGLNQLGLARNEVIIEIVEEGSRGVLGMGVRDAVVRLTPLRAPTPPPQSMPVAQAVGKGGESTEEEAAVASAVLSELLAHMRIKVTVQVERAQSEAPEEDAPWVLNIHGADLGVLIGRRGETLNALQYITRLIVSREIQRRANIVIDVEGYKSRREDSLRNLAHRMAAQAKRLGRTVALEPMPPNERRIIHIALRDDNTVTTESVGTGDQRKVTIIPVRGSSR